MPFRFNALLAHAGIDPKEVRLLRNHAVPADAADLFELWKRDVALFEAFQSYQKVSARAYFASPWWASFVTTRDGGTAFVGMYRAANPQPVTEPMVAPITGKPVEPGSYEQYQVTRDEALAYYAGRLLIEWGVMGPPLVTGDSVRGPRTRRSSSCAAASTPRPFPGRSGSARPWRDWRRCRQLD